MRPWPCAVRVLAEAGLVQAIPHRGTYGLS
jgi:hypothetical protein